MLSWTGQSQCFLRCPLSPDGFCPFRPRVSTRRFFVPLCVTTRRRVETGGTKKFRMFTRLPLLRVVGMAKRYGACWTTRPLGRVWRSRSKGSASTEAPARANGRHERASEQTNSRPVSARRPIRTSMSMSWPAGTRHLFPAASQGIAHLRSDGRRGRHFGARMPRGARAQPIASPPRDAPRPVSARPCR